MAAHQTPMDRIMAKSVEDTLYTLNKVRNAWDVLLEPLETQIATTPCDIVYHEDRVRLKHYRSIAERRLKTPLLVIYALINRETMLDLQPDRSVVRNFLEKGVDVYMVDWGYPTRKDRYLTIDDHVNGYIDNIVDFICKEHRIETVNIMGVCMGGTFGVIYAALHPHKVRNLVTTVTPTNFNTNQGLLHLWMKAANSDGMVDNFGNIPGDLLNLGFLMLNPARLIVDKYRGFLRNLDNKAFVEEFIRMEKWIFDSPDLPGETFRQFIKDCYKRNLLIQSKMEVGGRLVDLKKIRIPLLNIYGKYDHLVPPEACSKLTAAVGSDDTEDICLNTGHIGIYVSSKCQKELTPRIVQWLSARDSDAPKDIKVTAIASTGPNRKTERTKREKASAPTIKRVAASTGG
jgi:polyhydroxyalkanoate synthase